MFGAFDISTSALTAQRTRLDTISSNIANIDSVLGPDGKPAPYRRLFPIFQAQATASGNVGVGVTKIDEDQSEFKMKYEPGNRAANAAGMGAVSERGLVDGIRQCVGNDPGLRSKHYSDRDDQVDDEFYPSSVGLRIRYSG